MDPSHMTMDKLKKELEEHDVPLPKHPRKEVLVELYRSHVLDAAAKNIGRNRLAYSDEDEVVENTRSRKSFGATSKRRSVTTRARDEAVISSSGINVSNMSDAELMESLQKHGANVGPVTETTRIVYEKKLAKLLDSGPRRTKVPQVSPLKKKVEEQPTRRLIHYSDEEDVEEEEEQEEEEEEEKEEEEGHRNNINRHQPEPLFDRRGNKDYEDSFEVRSRYTASDRSYDPPSVRRSTEFGSRPPLSSFGTRDAFSSQPFSSGLTSTTRRSHVYTSAEYSSTPRPTSVVKGSAFSETGISRNTSHVPFQAGVPKQNEKKRGKCFWLFIFFFLLIILVLSVVIWNMDPAFRSFALPSVQPDDK